MLDSIKPIKKTQDLYHSLIEAALDPMVTICPQGLVVDANEAMANIMGLPQGKINGSDFFLYFTDPALARKVYQRTFE